MSDVHDRLQACGLGSSDEDDNGSDDEHAPQDDLSLRELRSRLLGYGLSTTGIKAELRARLEDAMLHFRAQHKTWDTEKMAWV